MKKLLLLTGDIAAGKTTFSNQLSQRYRCAVFQKDTVKELLSDRIGFETRQQNKALSLAAVDMLCHAFSRIAASGQNLILEANFHEDELQHLHSIAREAHYTVLTLVLSGDVEVLYRRYLHRMNEENRHPAHLATTLHLQADFAENARRLRAARVPGAVLAIDATSFSYQADPEVLRAIDAFMNGNS